VTGDELARLLADGAVTLIDVRSPAEYAGEQGYPCDPVQGHIEGAVNLPLDELQYDVPGAASRLGASRPIVAYCHSGQRSEIAAALLRSAGLDAENYPGSWHEWSRRSAQPPA
jgi:thiosulfate/3-mercaptopyruvate sulfurtransferase